MKAEENRRLLQQLAMISMSVQNKQLALETALQRRSEAHSRTCSRCSACCRQEQAHIPDIDARLVNCAPAIIGVAE